MRSDNGRIALLELHADRLRQSAHELEFRFEEAVWRHRVVEAAGQPGIRKVRSLLRNDGTVEVTTDTLPSYPPVLRAVLSMHQIVSDDVYRRHKTTRRRLYDQEWRRATSEGFDEVLFLNERGECVEGSRTNIIVTKAEKWFTPPVSAGALPGVYRRYLLETKGLAERRILPGDFETADEVYLCNAVHGLVSAEIVLAPDSSEKEVRST